MNPSPNPSLSDHDLHAAIDGQMPEADRAAFLERLASDAPAAAQFSHWQHQRDLIKGLHRQVLDEAVPAHLLAAGQDMSKRQQRQNQWLQWGGMAASVLLAFGLGWTTKAQLSDGPFGSPNRTEMTSSFVNQAGLAYAAYVPETRHPVEVAASDQSHMVQWLSKRLGRQLIVPDLSAQGYELVGGRLLPGDPSARAQMMFQNAKGTRVTLYLGAVASAQGQQGKGEVAFSYAQDGAVPSFFWADQYFAYALSGQMPKQDLMQLATAVFNQLGH
jgi:anti-sigma factor RsiW